MSAQKIYSKKEISKILTKASEIQTAKDLYDDQQGLNEEELIHVAEEVGISKKVLQQALLNYETEEPQENFKWLFGTSRVQQISIIDGELTNEKWEKVIQEIRRITGGIGKTSKVGSSSYEWEQRRKEMGYKHFSLSHEKDKTRVRYISSWSGVKMMSLMFSFMIPFAITAIGLDGAELQDVPALLLALGGGTLGLPFGMLFLKNYFNKQKKQLKSLFSGITKIIKENKEEPSITIEEEEVYNDNTFIPSSAASEKSGA